MECLNIGVIRKTSKNVIISCIYRPLRGDAYKFLDEMKAHIIKIKIQEKPLFLVVDLNSLSTILETRMFVTYTILFFKILYFL